MMVTSFIGLGSNMGDRAAFLDLAIEMMDKHPNIFVQRRSSIYETDPYGPIDQAPFLNMVIEVGTDLSPPELLKETQTIENKLDRERLIHWGPRTIDLDILIYADKIIQMDTLIIPHPEIQKRLFVLVPLKELNQNLVIPGMNQSVQELYGSFKNQKGVRLWKQNSGVGESGLSGN